MASGLSSDVLEAQFGPTVVEVLGQTANTRVICTKVEATGQILEVSLVTFRAAGVAEFPAIHQTVLDGQSMGKVFRAAGVAFERQTTATRRVAPPPEVSRLFGSDELATVVGVTIVVGPRQTPYADIVETYSPAVDWPKV